MNVTGSFAKWFLEPNWNWKLKNISANLHGCTARLKGLDTVQDYEDNRVIQTGVLDQWEPMDTRKGQEDAIKL